jgi:hypothetical protein
MNTHQPQQDQRDEHQRNKHREGVDEKLERALRTIDPPGREVSDDELRDPGNAIPSRGPTDNRS